MSEKNAPIRLHSNENFYGCSPEVLTAIRNSPLRVHEYPAPPVRLEAALARKLSVDASNIVVGAGSVRLIDGIIQTFSEPGEEIMGFDCSFVAYRQLSVAHRRNYVAVPHENYSFNTHHLLNKITPGTRIVFIANPNNPTGTVMHHSTIEQFIQKVPAHILVVLDEAYIEYASKADFPDGISLFRRFPNVILLRTFSKIYGLAGLRVGYAVTTKDKAEKLQQSRIPFFLNALAEEAALSALQDQKFIDTCASTNAIARDALFQGLCKAGLNALPSNANFIYVHFKDEKAKDAVFSRLTDNGLMVCNLAVFGQPLSLRIGVGNNEVVARCLACIS
ncbi:MAG: histidinol-phosphate transaminase [Bacteroidia bacterium]|nr:histidinol-phosphate transaminase [Bacteroidia bacterium]